MGKKVLGIRSCDLVVGLYKCEIGEGVGVGGG